MIRRGGDDTIDAAGGRVGGRVKGRCRSPVKAPTEDWGGNLEGRGEGQSLQEVSSRARTSGFFDYAMYTKKEGGGGAARIRGLQAAGLRRNP